MCQLNWNGGSSRLHLRYGTYGLSLTGTRKSNLERTNQKNEWLNHQSSSIWLDRDSDLDFNSWGRQKNNAIHLGATTTVYICKYGSSEILSVGWISRMLRPNLTSQTVTFYKHVDQSEISAAKKAFVSNPKLYKHDHVFGCVCLSDKHEFSPES